MTRMRLRSLYLIAAPDGSAGAFAIGGAILAQYLRLGGPAGALGYPTTDATVAGRQTFKQGAWRERRCSLSPARF
jgi:uncharacterized protein with LGFP repeats